METPNQAEEIIAERYVLERKLLRPDTDIKKAIFCISVFLGSTFIIAVLSFHLSQRIGVFALLPDAMKAYQQTHPIWFMIIYCIIVYGVVGLCYLRTAIIGLIKLYQHYAPEDIRRRCLFMPTCSEYAILALKKYGLICGLYKTYIRLFKKCRGNIYRIDYP